MIVRLLLRKGTLTARNEARTQEWWLGSEDSYKTLLAAHQEQNGPKARLYAAATLLQPSGILKIRHRLNHNYGW